MPLSCDCDWDHEPGQVGWYFPDDYSVLETKTARKCCHCGAKIAPGDTVAAFPRYKVPEHDVEVAIYGEDGEVPRSTAYTCEACSDLFFSFQELGYCVGPYEDMRELAREHAEMTAPQPSAKSDDGEGVCSCWDNGGFPPSTHDRCDGKGDRCDMCGLPLPSDNRTKEGE